ELLADRPAVERADRAEGDWEELGSRELLSPVTSPCRVVAQMVNYRSHAIDSGFDPQLVPTAFFRKASGSVTGPTAEIVRPGHVRLLDYEVELGLVLGAPLPLDTDVTSATLGRYVAALVVANDISARDLQLPKTQFYESKSYPTFTPLGPRLLL
ncbi:fumarylacetoacetate hydrolase family protein, partial [Streptomyces sp. MBT57]|nr:fumarylacetoacetate hydrolase family protein [Streptomyces sp. MBT57]